MYCDKSTVLQLSSLIIFTNLKTIMKPPGKKPGGLHKKAYFTK